MGYTDAAHALVVLALLKLPKHLAIRLDNLQPSGSAYMFQATYPPWPSLTAPPLSALYGVKGLRHLDIIHLRNAKKQPHLHLIAHGESSGIWFHICTRSSIRSSTRSEFNKLERLVAHLDTQDVTTFRLTILPEAVECLAFLRPLLMEMPSLSRVLIKCSSKLTPPLASDLLHRAEDALMPSSSPESSSPDGGAAGIPAPALDSLGIQLECPKAPVDALVRLTASRAQSGHPIRSLECNISGTTQEDLASVAEYVDNLDVTSRPLFNEISGNVPAVFKMKNDYWELFCREDGMEGWDLPESPD
ncbi:hypothetical protein OH76DRAFT_472466 [Lentinus brumalis]|uniref:Uncharacterized protein n=1 Tax=Lentinus brumalis TaxID=2498619 RepID=A0A371DD00_9APHY|nr:hypothetical protein OH76DRAFT_472466 [Polyporus brumalis]